MTEEHAPEPPVRFTNTRAARMARARLDRLLEGGGSDIAIWRKVQERVPEAWATLEQDIDCEEVKMKVTLRLDTSVVKFYRAMGKGYQARMNRILGTYAQMRIGEVERERRFQDEADVLLREQLPEELGEIWRRHREFFLAQSDVDLSWMDRIFDVGR